MPCEWGEDREVVRRDENGRRLDDLRRLERLRIMEDDFITEQDVLGGGAATHFFESREAGGSPLRDGTHTLYVNGEYRGDDPIGRLMSDFCQGDPLKMYDKGLAERVRYYKEDPKWVSQMCEIFEQVRNEGVAQGVKQGMAQAIRSLMDTQSVRAETAMDMLGVPAGDRDKYERLLMSTKA